MDWSEWRKRNVTRDNAYVCQERKVVKRERKRKRKRKREKEREREREVKESRKKDDRRKRHSK